MATISLYANQMNQMPGLIGDIKKSVVNYQSELSALRTNTLKINQSICDLSGVVSSIQASSQIQEEKAVSLDTLNQNLEQFVEDTVHIDSDVADTVRQRKDDFYEKYNYLKPKSEKNGWEKAKGYCEAAGEWCKEHWKEILITVVIVIGAVLAITAVVFSGGMALAPLIAGILTTFNITSTTVVTIATAISLTVAGIAVTSTIASSVLNVIDIWGDMSDNPTFQFWKTVMNWASVFSNLFYSVGIVYNSINGITCTQTSEIFNNGIAIGEKMATRVVPYATNNGLGYYNGLKGFNIINKISPKLATYLGTIQNRNFINWSMQYGINIFDIGPASSQITSVFYQMEQNLLSNYAKLFTIILP